VVLASMMRGALSAHALPFQPHCASVAASKTTSLTKGAWNAHAPPMRWASRFACLAQAPVGLLPTIQHCPSPGEAGGVLSPSCCTTGCTSASSRFNAAAWVTSFCACWARM
jgi:hypothetical protein